MYMIYIDKDYIYLLLHVSHIAHFHRQKYTCTLISRIDSRKCKRSLWHIIGFYLIQHVDVISTVIAFRMSQVTHKSSRQFYDVNGWP